MCNRCSNLGYINRLCGSCRGGYKQVACYRCRGSCYTTNYHGVRQYCCGGYHSEKCSSCNYAGYIRENCGCGCAGLCRYK